MLGMEGVAQDELAEKGALKEAGVYKYSNLIYLHSRTIRSRSVL